MAIKWFNCVWERDLSIKKSAQLTHTLKMINGVAVCFVHSLPFSRAQNHHEHTHFPRQYFHDKRAHHITSICIILALFCILRFNLVKFFERRKSNKMRKKKTKKKNVRWWWCIENLCIALLVFFFSLIIHFKGQNGIIANGN